MTRQSCRAALLVLVSSAMGAAFYAGLGMSSVNADDAKVVEFIKTDRFKTAKTVAVNGPGSRLVFIAGQVGMNDELKMPDDIGEQADMAFKNLDRELAAAGIKKTDVIKLTFYIKDMDLVEGGFVARSSQMYFDGKNSPVLTWVGVTSLILPEARVEIEAIAVAKN